MIIDCRNLACPEPVIRTKNALQSLQSGDDLEILINSTAPKENISRFLKSQNLDFSIEQNGSEIKISTTKTDANLELTNFNDFVCEITPKVKKTLYLNDERAGGGDVGVALMSKFIAAFLQTDERPEYIICVNNAVKMTANRAHVSFSALKQLEGLGVKILSCGSCLEAYKLVSDLAVGEITNAYEIAQILMTHEQITL